MLKQNSCMEYGMALFFSRYSDKFSGTNINIRKNITIVIINRLTDFSAKNFANVKRLSNISITLNCKGIEMLTQALAVGV